MKNSPCLTCLACHGHHLDLEPSHNIPGQHADNKFKRVKAGNGKRKERGGRKKKKKTQNEQKEARKEEYPKVKEKRFQGSQGKGGGGGERKEEQADRLFACEDGVSVWDVLLECLSPLGAFPYRCSRETQKGGEQGTKGVLEDKYRVSC